MEIYEMIFNRILLLDRFFFVVGVWERKEIWDYIIFKLGCRRVVVVGFYFEVGVFLLVIYFSRLLLCWVNSVVVSVVVFYYFFCCVVNIIIFLFFVGMKLDLSNVCWNW